MNIICFPRFILSLRLVAASRCRVASRIVGKGIISTVGSNVCVYLISGFFVLTLVFRGVQIGDRLTIFLSLEGELPYG